jgi:hypothetical protein
MTRGDRFVGGFLAAIAGMHQAIIASVPTNDDFLHIVLSRQVLAGDWPVRDFFDIGALLPVALSAGSQWLFGHRLLAEAVIVGVMLGISAYLVFGLVKGLTGSTLAAALSALLLIVAGPRGYSYPKIIVYAGAAALWWSYVRQPTRATLLLFGAWVAVAFYWRADHGVYVAISLVIAVSAAHGFARISVIRIAQAAALALALVAPFLVLAFANMGVWTYIESGFSIVRAQHSTINSHSWPRWPIRSLSDVISLDGPEAFAPAVSLRWTADSSFEARQAVLARFELTPVANDGSEVQVVRLSAGSIGRIRELVNAPIVEDTAGIERGSATLPWTTWSAWDRARFSQWWLRFRLFPGVNEQTRAGEATAAIFYALPLIVLVSAVPWLRRYLPASVTAAQLSAFAVVGLVTAIGLMRSPYDVRAVDNVVVPAILFGCCAAALWRAGAALGGARGWLVATATVLLALFVIKSVAVAGQFGDRVNWLAGDWQSIPRMRGAWVEVRDRLVAGPPLSYWRERPAPVQIRLAQYASQCVPPSKRLLVLWFAPEIYYYADRLMASRHFFFESGYESLANEQRLTVEKIRRFSPPLVFATAGLDTFTSEKYPGVVEYVHRQYEPVGSVEDEGERYVIFLRRDERVVGSYGDGQWPCLV